MAENGMRTGVLFSRYSPGARLALCARLAFATVSPLFVQNTQKNYALSAG